MKSVACLVTICEDEHSPILIDIGNRIKHLDEHMWQEDRVSR